MSVKGAAAEIGLKQNTLFLGLNVGLGLHFSFNLSFYDGVKHPDCNLVSTYGTKY